MLSVILLSSEYEIKSKKNQEAFDLSIYPDSSKTRLRLAIEKLFEAGVGEVVILTSGDTPGVEREIRKFFDPLIRLEKLHIVKNLDSRLSVAKAISSGARAFSEESKAFFVTSVESANLDKDLFKELAIEYKKQTAKSKRNFAKESGKALFLVDQKNERTLKARHFQPPLHSLVLKEAIEY